MRKAGLFTTQLEEIIDFYEKQNEYFDLLSDEKWHAREEQLLKNAIECFICNEKSDLIIYHKSPSSVCFKPWKLSDEKFDYICKTCNRSYRAYSIGDYFEFLIPAFHHAGYYREDVVDLVADDYLCKFIGLLLKEIRRERLAQIPQQHLDSWSSKNNITYEQLMLLTKEVKEI